MGQRGLGKVWLLLVALVITAMMLPACTTGKTVVEREAGLSCLAKCLARLIHRLAVGFIQDVFEQLRSANT